MFFSIIDGVKLNVGFSIERKEAAMRHLSLGIFLHIYALTLCGSLNYCFNFYKTEYQKDLSNFITKRNSKQEESKMTLLSHFNSSITSLFQFQGEKIFPSLLKIFFNLFKGNFIFCFSFSLSRNPKNVKKSLKSDYFFFSLSVSMSKFLVVNQRIILEFI